MRLQGFSGSRLSAAIVALGLALCLAGCAGIVVVGALGSMGAAGGLAVTEKDREATAGSGGDAIPPAQRVPPAQQTAAPTVDETPPLVAPRQAVTVQPLAPR